jgi:secondary thiamine-phosphate synthase enzyme
MHKLKVKTTQREEFIDITAQVDAVVKQGGVKEGVCVVFVPHTTAGLTINENADPSVRADILAELGTVIPHNARYTHAEGNSAAHIKTSLIGSSVTVPIERGALELGTWQGIYFSEFDGPRTRDVWITIIDQR